MKIIPRICLAMILLVSGNQLQAMDPSNPHDDLEIRSEGHLIPSRFDIRVISTNTLLSSLGALTTGLGIYLTYQGFKQWATSPLVPAKKMPFICKSCNRFLLSGSIFIISGLSMLFHRQLPNITPFNNNASNAKGKK